MTNHTATPSTIKSTRKPRSDKHKARKPKKQLLILPHDHFDFDKPEWTIIDLRKHMTDWYTWTILAVNVKADKFAVWRYDGRAEIAGCSSGEYFADSGKNPRKRTARDEAKEVFNQRCLAGILR